MNACDSFRASDTVSLDKQVKTEQRLVFAENHSSQRSSLRLNEAQIAGETVKALLASAVSAIPLSLRVAGWTVHLGALLFQISVFARERLALV